MNKRIQRILELNKKRTQGEWDTVGGYVYKTPESCPETNHLAYVESTIHDALFMSHAPEMVEIIEDLLARNEELEAALLEVEQDARIELCLAKDGDSRERTLRLIMNKAQDKNNAS